MTDTDRPPSTPSRRRRTVKSADPFGDLPFVASREKAGLPQAAGQFPQCFWHVKPSGDYEVDCLTGERFALEYLDCQAKGIDDHGPGILQWIVADMPRDLSGIEVSFLTIIAHSAAAGRAEGHRLVTFWEMCRLGRDGRGS